MAEATITIDGINVHITSDIFSVKFMNLIKTIFKKGVLLLTNH
jgi:hypothetical protein